MFYGIFSVNFVQSSFYISDNAESERTGKKKNSPQKLKFQHLDLIMISASNFRSNFRNWAKPTLVEHQDGTIVKSVDKRSERKFKATSHSKT